MWVSRADSLEELQVLLAHLIGRGHDQFDLDAGPVGDRRVDTRFRDAQATEGASAEQLLGALDRAVEVFDDDSQL